MSLSNNSCDSLIYPFTQSIVVSSTFFRLNSEIPAIVGAKNLSHQLEKTMHFRSWFREDSLESIDFGGLHTITLHQGIYLLINNAVGPGLVFLPIIYQQTGLLTCSLIIIFLSFVSCIVSMTMVESMQKIPDNEDLSLRVEYLDLIKYYCEPFESKSPRRRPRCSSSSSSLSSKTDQKVSFFQSQLLSTLSQILFYLFMISLIITNIIQV